VLHGKWAGQKGIVQAAEQEGTVVVKLCDAAQAPLLTVEHADLGYIMPQSA